MKITKKNYPERLRKIINKPKSCELCAATMVDSSPRNWDHCDSVQVGHWCLEQVYNICNPICRDFVKLKRSKSGSVCPCICIGKKRAIIRAEKYLKLWDQGKHHWQKEEKK